MSTRFTVLAPAVLAVACAMKAQAAPRAWAACAACHAADSSAAIGPPLTGISGRKAGTAAGFAFSRAMKGSGITWDEKSLAAFLADPQRVVPGNRMPFTGITDPRELAEVVDYLKTLR